MSERPIFFAEDRSGSAEEGGVSGCCDATAESGVSGCAGASDRTKVSDRTGSSTAPAARISALARSWDGIRIRLISTSKNRSEAIQKSVCRFPGRQMRNPSICERGRPSGKVVSDKGRRAEIFLLKQFRTAICSAIRSWPLRKKA